MKHRIRNCRRDADDADFADAFRANRIHVRIVFFDHDHIDRRDVRIHRDEILAEVDIGERAEAFVEMRFLEERRADALDDSTGQLAACSLRVENAAARECAHHSSQPNHAKILVDTHLRELRAERVR